MAIAYTAISALGIVVFGKAADYPVMGLLCSSVENQTNTTRVRGKTRIHTTSAA
jgi:hypothetical protein